MSALAGYLAVAQLAQHLDLALPDDIAAGEHVTLGVRSVRPDGRSSHDPSFRWPWPGNWTPHIDADTSDAECSYGLHIALGWLGLSATGPVHVCQIVAYRESDVAHRGATKLRVSQAAVLDVWDVHRIVRYANLRSANLRYANLSYANLRYADLSYANLRYANLSNADLSNANLSNANLILVGQDIRGYLFWAFVGDSGSVEILAGCRHFVGISAARQHWSERHRGDVILHEDCLSLVDRCKRMAKVRGWNLEPK